MKMKKQILQEMEKLKRFERVALNSVVVDDLNELEMKFIIEKIFEANDMIVRLQNVLKEMEEK
jgi:hypothetical protein